MNILVTGGAGFIGSNFVRWVLERAGFEENTHKIVVLDALTYAGNLENLAGLESRGDFRFVKGDIRDRELVQQVLSDDKIDVVMNFAAESHVDRSIHSPLEFVRTNIEGTQVLLLAAKETGVKRYLQVSTDEVYGSLGETGSFVETTRLDPTSAYAASKASADMLVLAEFKTHKMDVCVSRCTNNYGPYQFPEKLIPLFITNALEDKPLPLYGDGKNVRSWLHVDDHSSALMKIVEKGRPGEVYNIGGTADSERPNIEVTKTILSLLDKPESLIKPVEDRKGHDLRYSVDFTKIQNELGWEPTVSFDDGLKDTVSWYLDNRFWWESVRSGEYREFYEKNYRVQL